ncbi:MAG: hypothetical protein K2L27_07610 [Muribaculaceae bacterium]|nr:hypothetical protein [Muribaculaceae bacterium]
MKRIFCLLALVAAVFASAQHTTRRHRPRPEAGMVRPAAVEVADTVAVADSSAYARTVVLSGFDKTLASRRESFFVTNTSDSAEIVWLALSIHYYDTAGRQLHSRRTRVRCNVPPLQTRRIDIPAWDRQGVYYYRGSEPRRRVQAAAAPFEVSMSVDSFATAR